MLRRTPTAVVLRLMGERPGTAAMLSASASASASRRHSAGSRRSPGKRSPGSVAVIASDGHLPSLPPPTIWGVYLSCERSRADAKGAGLPKAFCPPLAHRRNGHHAGYVCERG